MNKIFLGLFIILSLFFLIRYSLIGQAVYGDAIYYWAYARSLYFDQTIDLTNELNHHYSPSGNNREQEPDTLQPVSNVLQHHLPIGPGLAWIGFLALADSIILILHVFGIPLMRNGYSDVYQITAGIGNISFVIISLYFIKKFVSLFYASKPTIIALLTILFGTNLLYYGSLDVINSHPFSFMLSSIFIYTWYTTRKKRSNGTWMLLGFLLGLLTMTRTQEILFGLFLLYDILQKLHKDIKNKRTKKVKSVIKSGLLSGIGLLIGFSPQLLLWKYVFGDLLESPYLYGTTPFNYLYPNIYGVLLDYKVGLLFYSPLVAVSLIGLFFLAKKDRPAAVIFLVFFLLQLYLIASWRGWHQGASYGIRMLITSMPIVVLSLTALITWMMKKFSLKSIVTLSSLFILYNVIMIAVFQIFIQDPTFDRDMVTQHESLRRFYNFFRIF